MEAPRKGPMKTSVLQNSMLVWGGGIHGGWRTSVTALEPGIVALHVVGGIRGVARCCSIRFI